MAYTVNNKLLLDYPDSCYDWISEYLKILTNYFKENNWFQEGSIAGTDFQLVLVGERESVKTDLESKGWTSDETDNLFFHLYFDSSSPNNSQHIGYVKSSDSIKEKIDKVNQNIPEVFNKIYPVLGKHTLGFIDYNKLYRETDKTNVTTLVEQEYGLLDWNNLQIFSWIGKLVNDAKSVASDAGRVARKVWHGVKKVGGEITKKAKHAVNAIVGNSISTKITTIKNLNGDDIEDVISEVENFFKDFSKNIDKLKTKILKKLKKINLCSFVDGLEDLELMKSLFNIESEIKEILEAESVGTVLAFAYGVYLAINVILFINSQSIKGICIRAAEAAFALEGVSISIPSLTLHSNDVEVLKFISLLLEIIFIENSSDAALTIANAYCELVEE